MQMDKHYLPNLSHARYFCLLSLTAPQATHISTKWKKCHCKVYSSRFIPLQERLKIVRSVFGWICFERTNEKSVSKHFCGPRNAPDEVNGGVDKSHHGDGLDGTPATPQLDNGSLTGKLQNAVFKYKMRANIAKHRPRSKSITYMSEIWGNMVSSYRTVDRQPGLLVFRSPSAEMIACSPVDGI